jgi:hypothetical protein
MTEEYVGKWYHVYFDIFFTSTKLLKLLLERKLYACGTARLGQKDWPKEFRNPKMLKLKRGESQKLQHESVTAIVWHDKRDVLLLSTNSDPRSDRTDEKKIGNRKQKIQIPCPNAVMNYTCNMGGVDSVISYVNTIVWGENLKSGGHLYFIL